MYVYNRRFDRVTKKTRGDESDKKTGKETRRHDRETKRQGKKQEDMIERQKDRERNKEDIIERQTDRKIQTRCVTSDKKTVRNMKNVNKMKKDKTVLGQLPTG